MSTIDPRQLRDAFGAFLTGVTVVTTHDSQSTPLGFTANSFSSVSLDPPLLLISLAKTSRNYDAFTTATGFAVNILTEDQKDVSQTFATPVDDRFATVTWQKGPHGSPVIDNVAAWFDCSTHQIVEAGDHAILIGKVEAFENGLANGLGYARGAYFTPALEDKATSVASTGTDVVVSAIIDHQGEVLFTESEEGNLELPHKSVTPTHGASEQINTILAETKLQASVGFIYSVYEDMNQNQQNIIYHCAAADTTTSSGAFYPLNDETFARIKDSATIDMLKRLQAESWMGNYGIYFGNQNSGEVRQIVSGA
ncbi:flavin reductase [Kiloniella spongiae]|uniref:Flavin reductase n=1 Tax=Kiloniella spongiae TaxID=1489064 RepID=A0A0H2MD92_9PROT|nr:flavin reductase family protein [Kiloniella spongiae]KLN60358.1 flavin reductase [Kiloniella spongiae]